MIILLSEAEDMLNIIKTEFEALKCDFCFTLRCRIYSKHNDEIVTNDITCFNTRTLGLYKLFPGNIRQFNTIIKKNHGEYDKKTVFGHVTCYYRFHNEDDIKACINEINSKNVLASIVNN